VSVEVLKLPAPLAFSVAEPNVVLPSLMLTTPVGIAPVELTDTLNVTCCPTFEGFGLELRVVLVLALLTTCVSVADVLPAN